MGEGVGGGGGGGGGEGGGSRFGGRLQRHHDTYILIFVGLEKNP